MTAVLTKITRLAGQDNDPKVLEIILMLSKITLQPKTEIETLQNTTVSKVFYEEDSNGNHDSK